MKNKSDGPSCACGKGTDLYEEWKKLNEKDKQSDPSKLKKTKMDNKSHVTIQKEEENEK
jgi:hypothetical protein